MGGWLAPGEVLAAGVPENVRAPEHVPVAPCKADGSKELCDLGTLMHGPGARRSESSRKHCWRKAAVWNGAIGQHHSVQNARGSVLLLQSWAGCGGAWAGCAGKRNMHRRKGADCSEMKAPEGLNARETTEGLNDREAPEWLGSGCGRLEA